MERATEINVPTNFKRFIHHQEISTNVKTMPLSLQSSLAQATAFGVGVLLHVLLYRKGEWDLAIPKVLSACGMYLERVFFLSLSNLAIYCLLQRV
jgi:hypothetical protein